jgi:hypothetical protein
MWAALGATVVFVAGCATAPKGQTVLNGAQEVPPVDTKAEGRSDITVRKSKCPGAAQSLDCPWASGTVTATGMVPTAVHIHQGAAGQNGPVVLPLVKLTDTTWGIPGNTAITEAQYSNYLNGDYYINVHSEKYPNGEIRGQLKP